MKPATEIDEEKTADAVDASAATPAVLGGPISYPDGGLQAWATVLGCWLILFTGFGFTSTFGVFQDYYEKEYLPGRTPSEIAWIGSTQTFLMFSLSLVTGRLFDKGYYRWLLGVGTTLFNFGIMMLSISKQYYAIFLSQGVCLGIGAGCMFAPALSVPTHHFLKKRSLAIGLVSTGSSCGGIIYPITLNYLLASKSVGFGWSCRIIGFFSLACLIVSNLVIKTRLPPKAAVVGEAKDTFFRSLGRLLRDSAYMCAVSGVFLMVLAIFFPVFFIQTFALDHGITKEAAFYFLAITNGVGGIARIVANWFADIYGPMNMIAPFLGATAALLFAFSACTTTPTLIVFCILFGFFSGAYVSLLPSMQAGFARDLHEVGLRIGFTFSIVGVGALIGTPISGALLGDGKSGYHWWTATLFCGSMASAATATITVARFMQAKRKGRKVV